MNKHKAIRNLYSQVRSISISSDNIAKAFDENGNAVVLDETAIDAEYKRMQTEFEAQAYARSRADAYDPIPEQLDQIYHDMDGWKKRIKSVKDEFPKP